MSRPKGSRNATSRPHRVMVRLSEDERGWLLSRVPDGGTESDVLRGLIEEARVDETTTTECAYCSADVTERSAVPAGDDAEAWAELAKEHRPGCEWVVTRAHRMMDNG